jgi:IPT/TIG domain
MTAILRQILNLVTGDSQRTDRARFRRRLRPDLFMPERRVTPSNVMVTGLSPTFGPTAGGTIVTISGTGFTNVTAVDFGTTLATTFAVESATSILAESPLGSGTVDVTVTTPSGTSATSPADQFSYPPTVSGLNPTVGPVGGGSVVTITGAGFTGVTAVDFGTTPATTFAVESATSITAESPAGTGTINVTVVTQAGTSTASSADLFTYAAVPVVSGLSPANGPLAGDTLVTITGTGFTDVTGVDFGNITATIGTVAATTITAYSPMAAQAGSVDVTVTTPSGTSATSPADLFTYAMVAPTVSSFSPAFGPAVGGTLVTITGTGFTGATAVEFGTTPGTNLIVASGGTSLTVDSPEGTGSVEVTVTTPLGTSVGSPSSTFTYAPSISTISPTAGPTAGGTLVTITGTGFAAVAAVDFGANNPAMSVHVVSDTMITAVSPAGTGVVNVTVTTADGTSATSLADQFTYEPAIFTLSPNDGPTKGNTLVAITGIGFTGATKVDFGASQGTDLTVINDTTLTVNSPPDTGAVAVTVTTPGGASSTLSADVFTYLAAPTVAGISPAAGPLGGGTSVTITGSGFTSATAVDFGSNRATELTVISPTTVTVESPPSTGAGPADVEVTTVGGTSAATPADQFAYLAPPTLIDLNVVAGPAAGGTSVTITGSGFTAATTVDFGTTPGTNLTVVSDSEITVESPAGAGAVDVTVTTPGGTSVTSEADVFTYAPTILAISPAAGKPAGGTFVTITGTGFTGRATVMFGTDPGTVPIVVSSTTMTVISPAGTGTVDVIVTIPTPTETSATSPADQYTYEGAPTVSGVSPTAGPLGGYTLVTITGSGFTDATAVDFGTTPATNLTVVSDTTITAYSPATATAGALDVTVTNPAGVSGQSSTDKFDYEPRPTVSGLSVTSGPATGGTSVTISGTGFTNVTAVDFGANEPATNVTVSSSGTSLTVESPADIGTVDVMVTTPGGISAAAVDDLFTYGPAVTSLSPASGAPTGGTLVTITGTGFTGATVVDFGTNPATDLTVTSDTTITVDSPAGTSTVDVTVTAPAGTSATSPADQFTYVAAPTVSGLSAFAGPVAGGTMVTITGTNLANPTAIDFGGAAVANVISETASQIVVLSPAVATLGRVDVTVVTSEGTSKISPADSFYYFSNAGMSPTVSGISPSAGPLAGGTSVTISGTGFNPSTTWQVYFGAAQAAKFSVTSATTITATSPAGMLGPVNVTVVSQGGASAPSPVDMFAYSADGPQVTGLPQYVNRDRTTSLVIDFNEALDASPAQNISNYQLVGPGGHRIRVRSAVYDSSTDAVSLILSRRPKLRTKYLLSINGETSSGLTNQEGELLDGTYTGQPGSDYVTKLTRSNLAEPTGGRSTSDVVRARPEGAMFPGRTTFYRRAK